MLLHSVSVHVKFCVCPLRVESVCYSLSLSHMQSPLAFSAGYSGASFWGRIPELVQTLCSFRGTSTTVIILSVLGLLLRGIDPDLLCLCLTCLPYCGPSFCLWWWKIFYASLQIILIESGSVNSCNFAVPVGV